jgi:hypothetical protein
MGYTATTFTDIRRLGLQKGARVVDVGSQDILIASGEDLELVNKFIRSFGGTPLPKSTQLGQRTEVKAIYERAGLEHVCTDVDERPGTVYVDLNRLAFPENVHDSANVVVNAGTTEHLSNPVGGFALMHYVAKTDGILYHDVPLFGFGNHGLVNPTPKFWHALIWMNGYEPLDTVVRKTSDSSIDPGNFYHDYLGYLQGLDSARHVSWMIKVVLRKTGAAPFITPFDVTGAVDRQERAALIRAGLDPFLKSGVWTEADIASAIEHFFSALKKQRRIPTFGRLLQKLTGNMKAAAQQVFSR